MNQARSLRNKIQVKKESKRVLKSLLLSFIVVIVYYEFDTLLYCQVGCN